MKSNLNSLGTTSAVKVNGSVHAEGTSTNSVTTKQTQKPIDPHATVKQSTPNNLEKITGR